MNENLHSPKSSHAKVDGPMYILGQGDQRMTARDYEAYPAHNTRLPADVFDRVGYRQRLADDAGRLFSSSQINIDVAIRDVKSSNVTKSRIDSESSLDSTLEKLLSQDDALEIFFIIKQLHSWNHILATSVAMNRLLAHFDVFPQFLGYLHSFGLRYNEVGEDLPTFSTQHNSARNNLFEVCYDIRYPEKNGRDSGDPWSIRHTAVYYQYDSSKDTSMSLLIQPSETLTRQIDVLLKCESLVGCRSILIQHAAFVISCTFWKYFVVDMAKELNALEEKAHFSKVGVECKHDFPLVFKDYQLLQRLRKKLLKTRGFLEGNLRVSSKYELIAFAKSPPTVGVLGWYNSQLDISHRGVCLLLQSAEAVGETLLCIITYRNDEATRITTNAIHDNGRLLADLATLSNQSTDAVSRLTFKTQKDSRAMKVFTVVAALYLPASLMATIFSSNLVQLVSTQGGNSGPGGEHFAVALDFWMFPTFTVVLMILTLPPVWLWIRRPHSVKSREVEV